MVSLGLQLVRNILGERHLYFVGCVVGGAYQSEAMAYAVDVGING